MPEPDWDTWSHCKHVKSETRTCFHAAPIVNGKYTASVWFEIDRWWAYVLDEDGVPFKTKEEAFDYANEKAFGVRKETDNA